MAITDRSDVDHAGADDVLVHPDDFRVPTPRQLRALRILSGLTLEEVADELGKSESTIYAWEHGVHSPRVADLQTLLELYDDTAQTQFFG